MQDGKWMRKDGKATCWGTGEWQGSRVGTVWERGEWREEEGKKRIRSSICWNIILKVSITENNRIPIYMWYVGWVRKHKSLKRIWYIIRIQEAMSEAKLFLGWGLYFIQNKLTGLIGAKGSEQLQHNYWELKHPVQCYG